MRTFNHVSACGFQHAGKRLYIHFIWRKTYRLGRKLMIIRPSTPRCTGFPRCIGFYLDFLNVSFDLTWDV